MTFVCGRQAAPDQALRVLVKLADPCCMGSAEEGPAGCTCWEPEYDLEQQPLADVVEVTTRAAPCDDCAFRPDSPERQGDERYDHHDLEALTHFWCHQGIRKPVRWRHPAGIIVEVDSDAYHPPERMVDGERIPFRADGTPAERCAGFAARHRVGT